MLSNLDFSAGREHSRGVTGVSLELCQRAALGSGPRYMIYVTHTPGHKPVVPLVCSPHWQASALQKLAGRRGAPLQDWQPGPTLGAVACSHSQTTGRQARGLQLDQEG